MNPAAGPDRPPLDYAPGAPVRRRRRVRRVLAILTALAVCWAGWRFGPGMVLRGRQIYWQRQCLNFEPPPGSVVYERLPAGSAKPAVEDPFVDWDSPEVVAARPRMMAAMTKTLQSDAPTPVVVHKGPRCLLRLGQTVGGQMIDEGAIVFCHERTSPAGHRRLVTVLLPSYGGTDWILGDMLDSELQPSVGSVIGWYGPLPEFGRLLNGMAHTGPALPPPSRIFAGVPDPADPSRFSIEYEWPDGVHGFVDGRLLDDDTVALKIRPGEGDVPSTFERGLHQQR